jgi:hypothetical protein
MLKCIVIAVEVTDKLNANSQLTLCKHFWERRCMRRISICLIVNQIFRCDPLNFFIISTMDRVFSQKKNYGQSLRNCS